jgi:hypothetical protein
MPISTAVRKDIAALIVAILVDSSHSTLGFLEKSLSCTPARVLAIGKDLLGNNVAVNLNINPDHCVASS